MSTPEDTGEATSPTADEALRRADAVARRVRSHRRWYIAGTLVMGVVVAAFTTASIAWPERLAEVVIPGLVVVALILAALTWSGRTVPTAATGLSNRMIYLSAGLLLAALLLDRFALPEGFSVWAVVLGILPALPFLYLAWRVSRA